MATKTTYIKYAYKQVTWVDIDKPLKHKKMKKKL